MDSTALALAFYHQPFAHPQLLDPARPLPPGIDRLLNLALEARPPEQDELSSAEESRVAARFFVQQVFFVKEASHYRVLGLNPDASEADIKLNHRLLMRLFHPDRQRLNGAWADNYAQRINEAYTILRRRESRQRYDRSLRGHQQRRQTMGGSPESSPDGLRSVGIPIRRAILPPWMLRRLPETVLGVVALIAVLSVVGVYLSQHRPTGVSGSPVVEAAALPSIHASHGAPTAAMAPVSGLEARTIQQLRIVAMGTVSIGGAIPATPVTPATPMVPESLRMRLAATQVPVPSPRPGRHLSQASDTPPPVPRVRPAEDLAPPIVAVATAAQVAVSPAPRVIQSAGLDLSRLDLEVLASLFVGAYERGDLDGMMALFAEGVQTSDQSGKGGIRQYYQQLFDNSRRRQLQLSGLRWVRRGGEARGQGVFEASVEGAGRTRHFAGTLRLEVKKHGNQAVITGFFHRDLYHDVAQ